MTERDAILFLEKELSKTRQREDYYRSIAYFMAGYFHRAALADGIVLKEPRDLVDWAADMANLTAP